MQIFKPGAGDSAGEPRPLPVCSRGPWDRVRAGRGARDWDVLVAPLTELNLQGEGGGRAARPWRPLFSNVPVPPGAPPGLFCLSCRRVVSVPCSIRWVPKTFLRRDGFWGQPGPPDANTGIPDEGWPHLPAWDGPGREPGPGQGCPLPGSARRLPALARLCTARLPPDRKEARPDCLPGREQAGACPSTGLVGEDGDWMWPGISQGSVTVPGHTLWPTTVRWTVSQTRAPCQGPGGQEQARGPWGARRPQPQSSGTPARSSMPGGACSWATPCIPTSPQPAPQVLVSKEDPAAPSCGLSGGRPGSIGGPSAAPPGERKPLCSGP